ncbi:MAG: deoxyribonuclease IV [Dehalococcoidia bacterium]
MTTTATQGMQIGGHVSAAGGLYRAIERGVEREMEAIQIFVSAPQTWRATKHSAEDIARFRDAYAASGIGEVWIHNIYLANLATDTSENTEQLEKSVGSVVNAMRIAEAVGAQGVVLHTGSHRGRGMEAVEEQVVATIKRILDEAPGEAVLALETMAGQGGAIGTRFEDLGLLIREVKSPRLKTCLDTAHSFAAGYAIHTPEGLDAAMQEFDQHIGVDLLAVVHANDSKIPLGGLRDRHENIGDGEIETSGFETIMAHPAFQGRAFLLEVPGIATEAHPKGDGPDIENVNRLKAIRDALAGGKPASAKKAPARTAKK